MPLNFARDEKVRDLLRDGTVIAWVFGLLLNRPRIATSYPRV